MGPVPLRTFLDPPVRIAGFCLVPSHVQHAISWNISTVDAVSVHHAQRLC